MTINERIRFLRKEILHQTQQDFSTAIGLSRSNLGNIETGGVTTTDRVITSICREFNVNEEWLRTGNGEMFIPSTSSALDALAEEYDLSDAARIMIEKFVGMRPEARDAIISYCQEVLAALSQTEESSTRAKPSEAMTVEEAEALYIKSRSKNAQKTEPPASSITAGTERNKEIS